MNEQFIKTLAALESAENEMANLGNTLDSLERVNQAQWHETQTVLDYCTRLNSMGNNIRVMLGKREKAMLEGVLAQHVSAEREAVEHSVQADGFSAWAGDDDQGDGIGFAEAHGL